MIARTLHTIAHVSIEGWSDFANGVIHPVMNPAQMLVIVGLTLLVGRQEPLRIRVPFMSFAISMALALGLTAAGIGGALFQPILTGIALCLGVLVTIGKQVPPLVITGLCVFTGAVIGLDSGMESGAWSGRLQALAGTWVSACCLVVYLSTAISNATGKNWAETAVRIIGSWLVAISIMVLAFSFKG